MRWARASPEIICGTKHSFKKRIPLNLNYARTAANAAFVKRGNEKNQRLPAGGIGENSPEIRRLICEQLLWLGVEIEPRLNETFINGREGIISADGARLKVYVILTDEELLIARDTARLVHS